MAFFEVYLPPVIATRSATAGREANARFVRDGLSLFALLLPPLWLIWNRLWFALAVYIVFAATMLGLEMTQWSVATAAIGFLPALYLFLEGNRLVADRLSENGWQLSDIIQADTLDAAEYRWFDQFRKQETLTVTSHTDTATISALSPKGSMTVDPDRPQFGMFSED
jgi:hypothetical protein